ncbi:MAG: tyrosine-type recombinase/integrase [Alphaproteobacteria bacterium]|nr:tyrosine-type recombinase/integrase [Alphaproteobacteria bacterium]
MPKLTKRFVDTLKPEGRDYFVWDDDLPGFGLRVFASGKRSYLVQYRMSGRTHRYTIGLHGVFTPEEARKEALGLLGTIKKDKANPAEEKKRQHKASTVAELCDLYLREGCHTKKASTLDTDKGRIERHIKPLIGTKKIIDVTKADIERVYKDISNGKTKVDVKTKKRGRAIVRGGKGTASRTVGLLGGIFSFAVEWKMLKENPAHGIKRFKDRKCERFLSPEELKRLGKTLLEAENEGENPVAIAAIRALLFSGCRKSEILTLKKHEIDTLNGCLRLGDSKTGQKVVPLGSPALQAITDASERFGKLEENKGNPYVFPGRVPGSHIVGVPKVWERIRAKAELHDVRLHDLRHSFASVGAASGLGLVIIGSLLGHRNSSTTLRYSHIGNDPLRNAADSIAKQIADSLNSTEEVATAEVISIANNK